MSRSNSLRYKGRTAIGRCETDTARVDKTGAPKSLMRTSFPKGMSSTPSCSIGLDTGLRDKALGRRRLRNCTSCRADTASTETDPLCCCNYRVGIQYMIKPPFRGRGCCIDQSDSRCKLIRLETG